MTITQHNYSLPRDQPLRAVWSLLPISYAYTTRNPVMRLEHVETTLSLHPYPLIFR